MNGMSEAIAMHRSGGLSKRAKRENERRLAIACFGSEHVTREDIQGKPEPLAPQEQVARKIRQLQGLIAMASSAQGRKLQKEIDALEAAQ